MNQLTLWQEAPHASLYPLPGSDEARKMTAGSGKKLSVLLKNSDPAGVCLKILLESSLWASTMCYLTWKLSATPAGRPLFRLVPSVHRTEETEYGLWRTPDANTGNRGPKSKELYEECKRTGKHAITLNDQVKMWPTPCANCHTGAGNHGRGGENLQTAVKMWPTPAARDWRSGKGRQENGHAPQLPEAVGGQLNPAWVELLMGFPLGWTDTDIDGPPRSDASSMSGNHHD